MVIDEQRDQPEPLAFPDPPESFPDELNSLLWHN
jgi:hypothetical protein